MAKPKPKPKPKATEEAKYLPIEHRFPDSLKTTFTNQVTVQHTESGEFYINFFEIIHPHFIGEPDELKKCVDNLESVPSICVSRLVLTEDKIPALINALTENYAKFLKRSEKRKETKEKHAS